MEIAHYEKLLGIHRRIGSERELKRLIPIIMSDVADLVRADRISLFLVDWETQALRPVFAAGLDNPDTIRIPLKMGVVGMCAVRRQMFNVNDAYESPYFEAEFDAELGYKTESILAAPIVDSKGELLGAIELLNRIDGHFLDADEAAIAQDTARLVTAPLLLERQVEEAKVYVQDLCQRYRCERATLFVVEAQHQGLIALHAVGVGDGEVIRLNLKLGVAGFVAVTGQVLNIKDAYQDGRFDTSMDRQTGYHTRNLLCTPLLAHDGTVLGVAEAINKLEADCFSEEDIDALKAVSAIIAIALENAILFEEQDHQFKSILEVMAASIDAKDPLTAGHSLKVCEYACGIGREAGLSDEQIDVLRVASLLHDYGKLAIDDKVLKKPGKLEPDEYDHIKQHVVYTRSILEKMRFSRRYRNVPIIAAAHHETMDGAGYSIGLKFREIPLMTRIITVADIFEALTADRHYRKAMSAEEAFGLLDKGSGTKFEPRFIEALRKYWYGKVEQETTQA